MILLKRTFFDKVIIGILILLIAVFLGLASYTTSSTQRLLVKEKQTNLINEAKLLLSQTVESYVRGTTTIGELQERFDEFEDALNTSIWYFSENGDRVAASNTNERFVPRNLKDLNSEIDLDKGFTQKGDFYGIFESEMISIGIPIYMRDEIQGYLVLHTSVTELDDIQHDMLSIMYMPFMIMLLAVVLVLVFFSRTIIRPIAKLNRTAREYAKGNFEAKTGVHRDDEIGELSESLEYMAGELSKLDEYRKNFIANISHDFRSPLTSIKGYLEAMLDGTIPAENYDRYLGIVLNEAGRLTKLTAGLLELNDVDNYGLVLKRQMFDVVDVVRETRNTVEGRCLEKNIDFRLSCVAGDTVVYADRMRIGQVINNLVDNAIKFSPQNSRITVTVTRKNDKVFVSVKDEGPGIPKDKQNKVWVRFYKTDSSRGKDKKGTGLGLAITKEIIKAHGENIDLISTEGAGSEFVFSLPTEKGHVE